MEEFVNKFVATIAENMVTTNERVGKELGMTVLAKATDLSLAEL